jgi:hypothetical protein
MCKKKIDKDLEEELTPETFDRWEEEWKKKHPVRAWIDKLFKNESLADYRASYSITHPWVFFPYIGRHIKWAWQRVFRGWDDRIIWSIDFYLAEKLPVWLKELKEDKRGIPSSIIPTECLLDGDIPDNVWEEGKITWDKILDEMIDAFNAYIEMDDIKFDKKPEYAVAEARFNKGFDLFKKHFGSLWD